MDGPRLGNRERSERMDEQTLDLNEAPRSNLSLALIIRSEYSAVQKPGRVRMNRYQVVILVRGVLHPEVDVNGIEKKSTY